MDKFYTEKNVPFIDPSVSAKTKHVEMEQLKILSAGYSSKNNGLNTKHPSPLENKINRFLKRSFDIAFSMLFIICVLSWLIPLMAILVKLDSKGPVFFLQKRTGLNGKLFTCIKFRSMIMNAEADLLAEQENDQRITGLGKFIRLYHIDELPQFINVLMGDMSIIGPRPYMLVENKKFETLFGEYTYRHTIRPGITGFAQSRGNFGATMDIQKLKQRTQLDILYIQNWSPVMDAKILARTLRMMTKKIDNGQLTMDNS